MLGVNSGAGATIQLPALFALSAGSYAGVPFSQSPDFGAKIALGVQAFFYYALRKWDFYVGGSLTDITRRPSTYFTFGFEKR